MNKILALVIALITIVSAFNVQASSLCRENDSDWAKAQCKLEQKVEKAGEAWHKACKELDELVAKERQAKETYEQTKSDADLAKWRTLAEELAEKAKECKVLKEANERAEQKLLRHMK